MREFMLLVLLTRTYAQCTPNEAVNLARSCGSSKDQQCQSALSSTMFASSNCFDGSTGNFCHSSDEGTQWVRVDFETEKSIAGGYVWNRGDCCQFRTNGYKVWVGNTPDSYNSPGNVNCYSAPSTVGSGSFTCQAYARYLFVQTCCTWLNIAEIAVYPCTACAAGKYMSSGSCKDCPAGM